MLGSDIGVVLKRCHPYKDTVIILSREHGKIECTSRPISALLTLCPGMLVSFSAVPVRRGKTFVLHKVYKEYAPQLSTVDQLEWMHYLIYVSLHFLQFCDPAPDIFNFLRDSCALVGSDVVPKLTREFKCASLVRLLSLLGFCGDKSCRPFSSHFCAVSHVLVDPADKGRVDFAEVMEQELGHLVPSARTHVFEALAVHPRLRGRKVIGFDD